MRGVRESLVVDVGRLATTRDRPSAFRPSRFPGLSGRQEGWTPPPLVVVSAAGAGTVVMVCGRVRKQLCIESRGQMISRNWGWKVKRKAGVLKDMPIVYKYISRLGWVVKDSNDEIGALNATTIKMIKGRNVYLI